MTGGEANTDTDLAEHRETTNIAMKERNPNCCSCWLKVKIRSCLVVVCWSDLGTGPARETGAAVSHDHGLLQSPRDTQTRAPPGHQHSLSHNLTHREQHREQGCVSFTYGKGGEDRGHLSRTSLWFEGI